MKQTRLLLTLLTMASLFLGCAGGKIIVEGDWRNGLSMCHESAVMTSRDLASDEGYRYMCYGYSISPTGHLHSALYVSENPLPKELLSENISDGKPIYKRPKGLSPYMSASPNLDWNLGVVIIPHNGKRREQDHRVYLVMNEATPPIATEKDVVETIDGILSSDSETSAILIERLRIIIFYNKHLIPKGADDKRLAPYTIETLGGVRYVRHLYSNGLITIFPRKEWTEFGPFIIKKEP